MDPLFLSLMKPLQELHSFPLYRVRLSHLNSKILTYALSQGICSMNTVFSLFSGILAKVASLHGTQPPKSPTSGIKMSLAGPW